MAESSRQERRYSGLRYLTTVYTLKEENALSTAMGGSFSIKSVLPALFPGDDELNYHNLNPLVQNGGHAMTIFPQIKDMEPQKATEAREALLAYCHLDTLAMVRVWEKLRELSK